MTDFVQHRTYVNVRTYVTHSRNTCTKSTYGPNTSLIWHTCQWYDIHVNDMTYTSMIWHTRQWYDIHVNDMTYTSMIWHTRQWYDIHVNDMTYMSMIWHTRQWYDIHVNDMTYMSMIWPYVYDMTLCLWYDLMSMIWHTCQWYDLMSMIWPHVYDIMSKTPFWVVYFTKNALSHEGTTFWKRVDVQNDPLDEIYRFRI